MWCRRIGYGTDQLMPQLDITPTFFAFVIVVLCIIVVIRRRR
jgi:hypothetical protein